MIRRLAVTVLVALLVVADPVTGAGANVFLVESYVRQGRHDKALEALDGLGTLGPGMLLVKAQCLVALERPVEARQTLDALLAAHGKAPEAHAARRLIVQLLETGRDWDGLVGALRGFVAGASGDERSTWRRLLAHTYLRLGRSDEALEALSDATEAADLSTLLDVLGETGRLEAFVKEAVASGDRGRRLRAARLLALRRDHAGARTIYAGLMAEAPGDLLVARPYLDTLEALGLHAEAGALLERLTDESPEDVGLWSRLGDARFAQGDAEGARKAWRRIVDLSPGDAAAWRTHAAVLRERRMLEQAMTALREGRVTLGGRCTFADELVDVLADLGRFDEAAAEVVTLAVDDPDRSSAVLARLLRRGPGAVAACAAAFRTAVDRYPSMVEYYLGLDAVAGASDDPVARRRELAAALLKGFATDPSGLRAAAALFRGRGRAAVARELLERAAALMTGAARADTLVELADVELGLGRTGSALQRCEAVAGAADTPPRTKGRAQVLKGWILHHVLHDPAAAARHWRSLAEAPLPGVEPARLRLEAVRAALGDLDLDGARADLKLLVAAAPSGLRHEVAVEEACLAALEGRFDDAREALGRALQLGPDGPRAVASLDLLLFMVAHGPPAGAPEEARASFVREGQRYLRLRILLDERQLARYDELMTAVDPTAVPPELADDYLALAARSARLRGRLPDERRALEELVLQGTGSPWRDGAMLDLAALLARDPDSVARATELVQEHLLTYPDSPRSDEARDLLRRLTRRPDETGVR